MTISVNGTNWGPYGYGTPAAPGFSGAGGGALQMSSLNASSAPMVYRTVMGQRLGPYSTEAAINPEMYAADQKQSRFNTVFPWLQNEFGSIMGGLANSGVTVGSGPQITASQVLTPDQIQQQVNQSRAHTDMQVGAQQRSSGNELAGRGLGGSSPLQMALNQGYSNQGMATNAGNTANIRINAATQNAQQLLGSQTARANQFNQETQNVIASKQPYFNLAGQLFGAMGGLI